VDARAAAARWARAWQDGWEALDPEPILACYAADATLSTEPFRERHVGIDAVRGYVTRVFGEEEAPRVWMAEPIVDGARAAISWWASLHEDGVETTLAGTSVLRFGADGLVREQWDAWNTTPERRDPPDESPFRPRDT
jgi:nuclear transport factor 2 (NTF2) superfamily protein